MNYRHAFHAGNFADVMKHSVLALVIAHLQRKPAPYVTIDTHAGIGAYDLHGESAERTGEWRDGIGRVLAQPHPPAALAGYLEAVRAMNPDGGLRWYPGSPALAVALARPQDRLALVELHPEDNALLRDSFGGDRRIGIHHMDGYEALRALLPPPERRGVVLVDPPYEVKDEMLRLKKGLTQACRRWPTGTYLVWYPIKARSAIDRFHAELTMLGLPPTLAAEIITRSGDDPQTLNGCGLVILNPPWQLDAVLADMLPWLAAVLAPEEGGARVDWLVGEA